MFKMQKKFFKTMTGTEMAVVFKKRKSRDGNFLSLVFLFINASFNIFFPTEGNEIVWSVTDGMWCFAFESSMQWI